MNAQRDRRVAVKTSVAPLQVHHFDTALTVSTDAVGADFAEEEEMENDPDANEDSDGGDDDDSGDPATTGNSQGSIGVSERNVSRCFFVLRHDKHEASRYSTLRFLSLPARLPTPLLLTPSRRILSVVRQYPALRCLSKRFELAILSLLV